MSCFGFDYEVIVRDVDGNVKFQKAAPSESLLQNFGRILLSLVSKTSVYGFTDYVGASYMFMGSTTMMTSAWDLACGSGTAGVLMTDNTLAEVFDGQTGTAFTELSTTTTLYKFRISKTFLNTTGMTKTISEFGIKAPVNTSTGANRIALAARDLLSPAIVVNAGESIEIRYDFSFTP